ncbi:class I SAM-dependent methyltransferase [Candidatus Woesearchaeota archaeon]|nr:class I SAM-dependent methyltransferase [Candidatus Woesearchaeota archaeon]
MAYYGKISRGYDELYKEEQLKKLSIIKNSIKVNKNSKLLDVGCGTGISSQFNCKVIGIDSSIGLIKQNNKTKVLGIAECLPFKSNSFDYVISVTAIHNFKSIKKAIDEMKRVGKRDFVFSILKKSRKLGSAKNSIRKNFKITEIVEEEKDLIFFCEKP